MSGENPAPEKMGGGGGLQSAPYKNVYKFIEMNKSKLKSIQIQDVRLLVAWVAASLTPHIQHLL